MRRVFLSLALLILSSTAVQAQAERRTGFMAAQWCVTTDMDEMNRIMEVGIPIIKQLKEEGMIRAWYDIRHLWGDEWNYGFITVTDSHRSFLDYWSEYLKRLTEADPEIISRAVAACTLHKDNFYDIRDSG